MGTLEHGSGTLGAGQSTPTCSPLADAYMLPFLLPTDRAISHTRFLPPQAIRTVSALPARSAARSVQSPSLRPLRSPTSLARVALDTRRARQSFVRFSSEFRQSVVRVSSERIRAAAACGPCARLIAGHGRLLASLQTRPAQRVRTQRRQLGDRSGRFVSAMSLR